MCKTTLDEIREYMKNNKIGNTSVLKHEKIGNTVFPVTYHANGMVTVDYPPMDLFKMKKEQDEKDSTGSTDK